MDGAQPVPTTLFHIVDRDVWADARESGEYRPESLEREGFVHCSFPEQVVGVANARYREVENLCVVELASAQLDEIRVEDSYGEGRVFPHVYGPLPTKAEVAVHELHRDTGGNWTFDPRAPISPGGAIVTA
jgi:uncharacterized protein (DUF952 family)